MSLGFLNCLMYDSVCGHCNSEIANRIAQCGSLSSLRGCRFTLWVCAPTLLLCSSVFIVWSCIVCFLMLSLPAFSQNTSSSPVHQHHRAHPYRHARYRYRSQDLTHHRARHSTHHRAEGIQQHPPLSAHHPPWSCRSRHPLAPPVRLRTTHALSPALRMVTSSMLPPTPRLPYHLPLCHHVCCHLSQRALVLSLWN